MPRPTPGAGAGPGPVSVTSTTIASGSRRTRSRAVAPGPAWRRTFVNASWTTRCAANSTGAGVESSPETSARRVSGSTSTGRPAEPMRPMSAATSASPADGWRGAASPGPPPVARSDASSARRPSSASRLVLRMASSDSLTFSGLRSRTCNATPACMAITARPCPTTSCTSWAMRRRSSDAVRRASSARTPAWDSRRIRTPTPIAAGRTAQPRIQEAAPVNGCVTKTAASSRSTRVSPISSVVATSTTTPMTVRRMLVRDAKL